MWHAWRVPLLSPELQDELRGSFGGFLLATAAILFAVAINLLEKRCELWGLDKWLTLGMQLIAIEVFCTDAYSITAFCVKVVVRSSKNTYKALVD
jgi:hypothetical protein